MNQDFLAEVQELERRIDIEEAYLNFDDTFGVIRDFFKHVVLELSNLNELKINDEAKNRAIFLLDESCRYDELSDDQRKHLRVVAWQDVERFSEKNSKLIRLLLCSLWDKQGYLHSVATDMQDNFFTTILSFSYELDRKLGMKFRDFVEAHPLMQKYKAL